MTRRDFLQALISSAFFYSCGGGAVTSGNSNESSGGYGQTGTGNDGIILFGLGDDPYALFTQHREMLEDLKVKILCAWINGAKKDGRVYTPDRDWIIWWHESGFIKEVDQAGFRFMFITWENYDFQNPTLGTEPTRGDYHISDEFLDDMKLLRDVLRSANLRNKPYIALATEYTTYTACRYTADCEEKNMTMNSITFEYFSELKEKINSAIDLFYDTAYVGLSHGGWMVKGDIKTLQFFDETIRRGNAIFFQSMEITPNVNIKQIWDNVMYFRQYNKPIHLAHYMPVNEDKKVIIADASMMNTFYFCELKRNNLRSFSFMRYHLLEDRDVYNAVKSIGEVCSYAEKCQNP